MCGDLPIEVWMNIASSLNIVTIVRLSRANRQLRQSLRTIVTKVEPLHLLFDLLAKTPAKTEISSPNINPFARHIYVKITVWRIPQIKKTRWAFNDCYFRVTTNSRLAIKVLHSEVVTLYPKSIVSECHDISHSIVVRS